MARAGARSGPSIAADGVDAADRVAQEIQQAVSMLAVNPELGHLRRDLTSKPVRFWAIYSYLVIYDPDARPLEIVRTFSANGSAALICCADAIAATVRIGITKREFICARMVVGSVCGQKEYVCDDAVA